MNLKGRDFLKLLDFSPEEILYLVDLAADLKDKKKKGEGMLSLDPGFLWAGLAAGALLCLAAFKRRGFLFIAVGAAGCAVLHCQPYCIDDVDDEQQSKACRGDKRIPVGAQELTHLVVGGGPDQRNRIHQHMKGDE